MKKALLTSLLVLMILSSFLVSPVSAMPGTKWQTGIKIQNLHPTTAATFSIGLYQPNGTQSVTISQTYDNKPLEAQPGKSVEVFLPSFNQVTAGQYSAVVSSNVEVGAVVTNTNYDFGLADSYNTMVPANTISVPYVYHNHNYYSTEIFVQNTSTTNAANVTVSLKEPTSSLSYTDAAPHTKDIALVIPANGVASVDTSLPEHNDLGWFIGSATITSPSIPVAVVANQIRLVSAGNAAGNVMVSARGLTDSDAGSRVLLPSLYKDFSGASGTWKSGIKIQNLSGNTANITVTFVSDPGTPSFTGTSTFALTGNNNRELYLPGLKLDGGGSLPAAFRGSAIITSVGSNVVATVQHTNYEGSNGFGVAMGYAGFSKGNAQISLPTLYHWPSGAGVWVSGVKIQNYGTNTVNVTVTFTPDPDSISKVSGTKSGISLGNGKATELYFGGAILDGGGSLPQGWKGSAKIVGTSSGGAAQLVATVVNTNYGRNVANMYTGVAIP